MKDAEELLGNYLQAGEQLDEEASEKFADFYQETIQPQIEQWMLDNGWCTVCNGFNRGHTCCPPPSGEIGAC